MSEIRAMREAAAKGMAFSETGDHFMWELDLPQSDAALIAGLRAYASLTHGTLRALTAEGIAAAIETQAREDGGYD